MSNEELLKKPWDKINGDVAFYDNEHKYINIKNPFIKYTSVTTLISEFYEEFDEDFMSKYKAMQALAPSEEAFLALKNKTRMTQTKIWNDDYLNILNIDYGEHKIEAAKLLAEWAATNKEACDIGTQIHLEKENEFYEEGRASSLVKKYTGLEGDFSCIKYDFDLSREHAVLPEYLVYYSCPENVLHIAGQVDLVIKNGLEISIVDFKTNRKGIEQKAFYSRTKGHKKMSYPVNNLHDTTMNHYNLQLSIYAYLLKKINPDFIIKELKIIHIDREGKETPYILPYLEEEVIKMLKFKKKKLRTEQFKNENTPWLKI